MKTLNHPYAQLALIIGLFAVIIVIAMVIVHHSPINDLAS